MSLNKDFQKKLKEKCVPSNVEIHKCMEQNEEYRAYALENSHRNVVEDPTHKYIPADKKMNFSSYDRDLNYFDPKTQLNAFYKCSSSLYENCKSNGQSSSCLSDEAA